MVSFNSSFRVILLVEKNTTLTKIELQNAIIYYRPEGFIHIHYKSHSFTLSDNQEIFETMRRHSPWDVCPFLITSDEFSAHDKESNIFNSSDQVVQHCSAYAFIARNTAQKLIVSFFTKIYRPNTPCRIFTSETDAVGWFEPLLHLNRMKPEGNSITC